MQIYINLRKHHKMTLKTKIKHLVLVAAVGVMAGMGTPSASYAKESVAVYGHGNSKCAEYNQYKFQNDGKIVRNYQVWLNGVVSTYNTFVSPTGDVSKGLKPEQMMAWVEDFCRLNPEAYFQRATIELLKAMETGKY